MKTIQLKSAEKNLKKIIEKTLAEHEETVIVSEKGSVVLVDEKEWEHLKETLRLLNDKKSLSALLNSHRIRDEGKEPEGKSVEEIFTVS